MQLTILRGLHDLDMVDSVYELVKDKDAIFIEMVGTLEEKQRATGIFHSLCFDDAYANSQEASKLEHFADAMVRLAYKLRGSRITILPVDVFLKAGETMESFVHKNLVFLPGREFDDFFVTGEIEPMYDAVRANIDQNLRAHRSRDKLVANQVAMYIKKAQENGTPYRNMALVQGYMHWSERFIKPLLPDIETEQKMYNVAMTRAFLKIPFNKMMRSRLAHPKISLSRRDIDIALASMFQLIITGNPPTLNLYAGSSKFTENEDFKSMIEYIEALDKLDDDALHAVTLEKAAAFRAKATQGLVDDPAI